MARASKGGRKTVDDYVAGLDGWRSQVVERLRSLIREAAPEAQESIKWAQPVWEVEGPVCYVKAFKNHVNFGFWRGAQMNDPDRLISSSGEKMGHIRLESADDIRPDAFQSLVRQAVELNRRHGNPTRPA
jgi:hypothetical protein